MNIIQHIQSKQNEMIDLLKKIVVRESPSSDKKAVDACSSFLMNKFEKTGTVIKKFPQRNIGDIHIIEYPLPENKKYKNHILILTHIDTVWPVGKIEQMPFHIKKDSIYGPGVLDMKCGLVMAYFALNTLKELNMQPKSKISLLINSAEEIGSDVSYEFIKKQARKSTYVLCLEPAIPGGALKLQRKGRLVIRLDTKGKSAHAGSPEKGINAIEELLFQIKSIQELKSDEISLNIGLIGGGEKANIVAENAWTILDIRFWKMSQKEKIIHFLNQLKPVFKDAKINYSIESFTVPMEQTKASTELFKKVKNIASSMGIDLKSGKTGGGSDASIASSIGIPTLDGLGPDGEGIHAEHEHLITSSFMERTALLVNILAQL